MTLFRLDASIRVEGSHSREIADIAEREWRGANPEGAVIRRSIGTEPIPATAWGAAAFAGYTPEEQRSPDQREAVQLATTLADELLSADAFIFAVPLYNYGVSQHFKTWVDMVITDPRFNPAQPPAIAGKPAILVTVHGGNYSEGTPRHGWDHATAWMQRILADVWSLDLHTVVSEFTLVGVNPALDEFKDVAASLRADAESRAREFGQLLTV
ncbi:flavodoxin family protein [Mycolicibacterium sp. 018/SC-01/001]|uniref:FMN-dependent NADH-azoreductase n=1 Tax=Mycolicibacterium sp. 018/SC-01/001 TaxID=2592069 RepID=UPI00117E5A5A|nr:NAD(P)H-dependent oxidoreductase [Mycolicibacterium sp. 018/SC-01/001]TRW89142.1 flavodoxin family protein [Mycolicibacterium sp. 018/SC-01/001]